MLFNSYEFIFLFLPITLFIYFYLNNNKLLIASRYWLILASLFFYGYWDVLYVPLIILSIIINYLIGSCIHKETLKRRKKLYLTIGILFNVMLLGYFKYVDFFIDSVNYILQTQFDFLNIALPLAISFFTFQQIAFLVDSYRDDVLDYEFSKYMVFVLFFPQLIAGPIVHHKEMMPQFESKRAKFLNYKHISMGLFIFSIGLFKKVVVADQFAIFANEGFDSNLPLTFFEAWATSLSYTFQLYFDFSGYTDMAVGIALLFNIRLPINFNSPYKATNIQEFWRRWHITLSRFLRDYIYIPLGGNKKGDFKTYKNLFLTFLIGGLWHGAGWTFVVWGAMHGFAIVIHRIWQSFGFKMWGFLAWFVTFNFINLTWVFFRAESFERAIDILRGMVGLEGFVFTERALKNIGLKDMDILTLGQYTGNQEIKEQTIYWIICATIVVLVFRNSNEMLNRFKPSTFTSILTGLIFSYAVLKLVNVSQFLYFNF